MIKLIHGDCLDKLKEIDNNSIDACITDPPYGLKFMGKKWDYDVPSIEIWQEVLRVLKPGGHLLSFGGTRTYHRLVVNIEDAGFEIRDTVSWIHGSGFPKGVNISKGIDKKLGKEREKTKLDYTSNEGAGSFGKVSENFRPWLKKAQKDGYRFVDNNTPISKEAKKYDGFNTNLKPACEMICLARKPISEKTIVDNVLKWGTGGINIDGCRVPYLSKEDQESAKPIGRATSKIGAFAGKTQNDNFRNTRDIEQPKGRYPANVIHDGSDEVTKQFPITKSGATKRNIEAYDGESNTGFLRGVSNPNNQHGDSGSAARFFYCAKASKKERGEGNNHPTVKPTKLMQYLVKLITPPDGIVLDLFMGSGSTGKAAILEGFNFIGIECEEKYYNIAKQRIKENKQKELF